MIRTIKTISVLGFLICLLIMYMTDHGIPGIRKYDPSFRLLDMHFHYSSETVKETFDKISEGGRIAYKTYLLLDFIFIVFFLITMFTISDVVLISSQLKIIICTVCGLRALFDVLENILLLRMLGQYPLFNDNLAKICPWLTSFKFIMLYIWMIVILSQTVICGLKSIKR